MPIVRCLRCGDQISLDPDAYWNYRGKVRCTSCKALHEMSQEGTKLVEWKLVLPFEITIPAYTPRRVEEDIDEALRCLENDASKGCVVMCRRALEQIVDLEAAKGKWLAEKLKDLHDQKLISNLVYTMASTIKEFGNYGAHPKNDLLQQVDMKKAKDVARITLRLLEEVYGKGPRAGSPLVLTRR